MFLMDINVLFLIENLKRKKTDVLNYRIAVTVTNKTHKMAYIRKNFQGSNLQNKDDTVLKISWSILLK